jgi:carbon storage regulator
LLEEADFPAKGDRLGTVPFCGLTHIPVISDNIKIRIVDVKSDTVKIGIDAPAHIKVYREEVWISIQEENIQAAVDEKKGSEQSVSNAISNIGKEFSSKIKIKIKTNPKEDS